MEELEISEGDSPQQDPLDPSAPAEAEPESAPSQVVVMEAVEADELLALEDADGAADTAAEEDARLKAVMEALVYVAEEPITVAQVAASLQQPAERIRALLDQLIVEFDKPEHGIQIREVAGGYRMATKAEHHDAVRAFVKSLKPPLKLSLPALETLAVIAYKQPVTAPEIKEIRGVQGTGVLSTLLDRKLIAEAGRKNVIGKPILYKTTKEFLIQFGLKDLAELPTLKEFEEIRRMAFAESDPAEQVEAAEPVAEQAQAEPAAQVEPETTAVVEASTSTEAEPQSAAAEAPPVEPEAPSDVEGESRVESETTVVVIEPQGAAAEAAPVESEVPDGTEEVVSMEPETMSVVEESDTLEAEPTAEVEPVLAADVVSESPDGGEEQPPVPPASEG
jgi:segregation and condensation protein B